MPRPRLLFVTQNMPQAAASCGVVRQYHLVRGLVERFKVTVATYRHGPEDDAGAERLRALGAKVEALPFDRVRDGSDRFCPRLGEHCARLCATSPFAVVQIEKFWMMIVRDPILAAVKAAGAPAPLFALDEIDVEFVRERRRAEVSAEGPQRASLLAQAEDIRTRELAACRAVDLVIAVTQTDSAVLCGEIPGLDVQVVPVGQDFHAFEDFHPRPRRGEARVIFVGHYAHNPNVDGVRWFVEAVWPLVRRAVPKAEFRALGASPPPVIGDLAMHPGVTVPGWIDDLRQELFAATVSVAPLRFGSGIKGKISEAMAAHLPVVTTSVGAEGMGLEHGVHALIADQAEAFAQAVVGLLNDPDRRQAIARAASTLARERFDAGNLARGFADTLLARVAAFTDRR